MIRGLVVGVLVRDPERKTAGNGKAFTKAILRVDCKQFSESDPDNLMAWVVAFGDTADALALKKRGDSISVAGRLDIRATLFNDRPAASVNVTADKLIDATRPARKAKPETETAEPAPRARSTGPEVDDDGSIAALREDVPF